jgi:hypothetical protein
MGRENSFLGRAIPLNLPHKVAIGGPKSSIHIYDAIWT